MFHAWLGSTLLVLLTLFHEGQLEDLVIARSGRLSVVSLCSSRELKLNTSSLRDVSALTYDPASGRLILAGSELDSPSRLWVMQMSHGAQPRPVQFSGAPPGRLEGLMVPAGHSALFGADSTNSTIVHVPLEHVLSGTPSMTVLHLLPDDRPRGLAVDETNGLLFWTNWRYGRQSVESSALNGSGRHRLADSDLYLPSGVAADPTSSSIFFSDAGGDGLMRVERTAYDGSARRVIYRGRHPQSTGLQLAAGSLYWSDSAGVWRLTLTGDGTGAAADAELVVPLPGRPSAVLVVRQDEQCTKYEPSAPTVAAVTAAPPGVCDDYCLVGQCQWNELFGRSCRCPAGFSGERCERDVCLHYCLAEAPCHRGADGRARCSCPEGVTGERCQHQSSSGAAVTAATIAAAAPSACACDSVLGLPPAPLLCTLVVLVVVLLAALVMLTIRFRRAVRAAVKAAASPSSPAPRQSQTKKRFVAVGRQLRPRPSPPSRDIEDCCQMTLCETPCPVSTAACERQNLVDPKTDGCDSSQAVADLF